jgi:hypothetical protein
MAARLRKSLKNKYLLKFPVVFLRTLGFLRVRACNLPQYNYFDSHMNGECNSFH